MVHGERLNTTTHLVGAVLAIAGLVTLVTLSAMQSDAWKVVSFAIYGATLVALYTTSSLYHGIPNARIKAVLQKLDHHAIYLLIAGSYTPIALVSLRGAWGWTLLGLVWGLALVGIVQEMTVGKTTRRWSMVLYVVMGWLVVVAIGPLMQAMPTGGLLWLLAGGLVYSAGIYFYVHGERRKHFHGIWHLFVLGGSACHYLCMLLYVV